MSCFLIRGSKNNVIGKVKDLQSRLKQLGYYQASIDGDFGNLTEAAVKAYQKAKKLTVDGCVGPQTWNSLFPASSGNSQPAKTALLIRIEKAVGGTFKTATQFYELVRKNEQYSHYRNDIYPQGQALTRLENNQGLNCADFSQIGMAALMELNKVYKTNYHVDYLRVGCKPSGAGHIILRVSGNEFSSPVFFDVAEAAAAGKPIGQTMCINGFTITSVNPSWLISDDGKT